MIMSYNIRKNGEQLSIKESRKLIHSLGSLVSQDDSIPGCYCVTLAGVTDPQKLNQIITSQGYSIVQSAICGYDLVKLPK